MPSIPLLDLHQYHEVDRQLFRRLVVHLLRNPAESLLAMAFWFWLEGKGFPSLVTRLLRTSDLIVNKVADEAKTILDSLADGQGIPPSTDTTFTTALLGNHLPLAMMHQDKLSTKNGIRYYIDDVCARIFTDILDGLMEGDPAGREFYQPLTVAGFPHPVFGNVTILKLPLTELFPVDDLWGWSIPM